VKPGYSSLKRQRKNTTPSFEFLRWRFLMLRFCVAVATIEGSQVFQGLEQRDETVLVA
jgi:hypothetical protein